LVINCNDLSCAFSGFLCISILLLLFILLLEIALHSCLIVFSELVNDERLRQLCNAPSYYPCFGILQWKSVAINFGVCCQERKQVISDLLLTGRVFCNYVFSQSFIASFLGIAIPGSQPFTPIPNPAESQDYWRPSLGIFGLRKLVEKYFFQC